jgi:hypothetical protein
MRVSRPCYDKYHRCPGWAGGGIRRARRTRCPGGGYITYSFTSYGSDQEKRLWKWRFSQCPKCQVYVLPYMTRWLDYGWWYWKLRDWKRDLDHWLEDRKERQ